MAGHGEQPHFKRVALSSGSEIEVLYFGDTGSSAAPAPAAKGTEAVAQPTPDARLAAHDKAPAAAPEPPALHVCGNCAGELVYPADWEEAGSRAWRVTLICPDCDFERTDVFDDAQVEAFDEQLDRGTDALARDYRALVRTNMAGEIERFITALDADAIQPMDF